jgi:hypothetical protein
MQTCQQWLETSYSARSREPVYKDIPPRIICVEYLGDPDTELFDYKLYCFNGRVRLIHVDTHRFTGHQRTFYTPDWQRLPFAYTYPVRSEGVQQPAALDEMTFFPDSGFGAFTPPEWDAIIGSYLELPAPRNISRQ